MDTNTDKAYGQGYVKGMKDTQDDHQSHRILVSMLTELRDDMKYDMVDDLECRLLFVWAVLDTIKQE